MWFALGASLCHNGDKIFYLPLSPFPNLAFYPLVSLRDVGCDNVYRSPCAKVYHNMNRNRTRVAPVNPTPLPDWISLNNLSCLNDAEHVGYADSIFKSFSEGMVRNKEVPLPNTCANGLDLHGGAE
jgi:hypothetical protein